jgi:hypothetical protein
MPEILVADSFFHDVGKGHWQGIAVRPAQRRCQVCLRVYVHEQNLFAFHSQSDAEVGSRGGLGDAALLVAYRRGFAI